MRGVVVRSGLGSYDCEVEIRTNVTIVCSMLVSMVNDLTGVSQACMPVPGSHVLVYVEQVGSSALDAGPDRPPIHDATVLTSPDILLKRGSASPRSELLRKLILGLSHCHGREHEVH